MTRQQFLYDCDPGIDDAFALFCAIRYGELTAVTTVSGNVPIEHTTRNAGFVLELAGVDVPVHKGAARPVEIQPMFADDVHGTAGLGRLATPEPQRAPEDTSAVEAILAHGLLDNATIVATGPLTNIANALTADPTLSDRIDHVYWMGGSTTVGNVTTLAEFNAWADPHAVDIVVRSGMPITMFGLNLTHQVRMTEEHVELLAASESLTGGHAADFLRFYADNGAQDGKGQPMHDPCAVLGLTHPELFDWSDAHMVVDIDGDDRGRTRMVESDEVETAGRAMPVRIAEHVDAPRVIDLITTAAITPRDPS